MWKKIVSAEQSCRADRFTTITRRNGRKRQPGAHFRPLYADAVGRLGQMVVGQSRWRTHRALAGVAQFQNRGGSHHALGKGAARTGVRKQTGPQGRLVLDARRKHAASKNGTLNL